MQCYLAYIPKEYKGCCKPPVISTTSHQTHNMKRAIDTSPKQQQQQTNTTPRKRQRSPAIIFDSLSDSDPENLYTSTTQYQQTLYLPPPQQRNLVIEFSQSPENHPNSPTTPTSSSETNDGLQQPQSDPDSRNGSDGGQDSEPCDPDQDDEACDSDSDDSSVCSSEPDSEESKRARDVAIIETEIHQKTTRNCLNYHAVWPLPRDLQTCCKNNTRKHPSDLCCYQCARNIRFRGGTKQTCLPQEELIERVAAGLKPVGMILEWEGYPIELPPTVTRIASRICWGTRLATYISATPNKPLSDLVDCDLLSKTINLHLNPATTLGEIAAHPLFHKEKVDWVTMGIVFGYPIATSIALHVSKTGDNYKTRLQNDNPAYKGMPVSELL